MSVLLTRLEQYTLRHPQEVLRITAVDLDDDGESVENILLIFRGFSSSLTHPTAFDPDIPLLSPQSQIVTVDRLVAPYNPSRLDYIAQDWHLEQLLTHLQELGL